MKTAPTRIRALLAMLLLVALFILSCSSCALVAEIENNSDSNSSSDPVSTQQPESEAPQTESEVPTAEPTASVSDTQDSESQDSTSIPDPFEGISFGGAKVLLTMPNSAKNEFSDESSGTALSEAVIRRNHAVEKRIQIQLIENILDRLHTPDKYATYLRNTTIADLDIGITVVPSVLSYLATEGLLRNLASVPINLQNPWFDASFLSAAGIGSGYVPFAVGDMNPSAWENSPAVLIKADLASEFLNLPGLYQTVRNRQWTLEALQEFVAWCNISTNLDALTVSQSSVSSMLFGANIRLIQQQDDTPYFAALDEHTISTFNRLSELLNAEQKTPILRESDSAQQHFSSGYTLLLIERLGYAQELAKADPTLKLLYLPLPLSDNLQSNYLTTPTSYSMLSIPNSSAQDLPLIGTTIEALGYDSTLTLPLSFLQTYLVQYGTGTAEAAEMFTYLLAGISFAPEILYESPLGHPWLRMKSCLTNGTELMSSYSSHFEVYGQWLNQLREQLSRYRGA